MIRRKFSLFIISFLIFALFFNICGEVVTLTTVGIGAMGAFGFFTGFYSYTKCKCIFRKFYFKISN